VRRGIAITSIIPIRIGASTYERCTGEGRLLRPFSGAANHAFRTGVRTPRPSHAIWGHPGGARRKRTLQPLPPTKVSEGSSLCSHEVSEGSSLCPHEVSEGSSLCPESSNPPGVRRASHRDGCTRRGAIQCHERTSNRCKKDHHPNEKIRFGLLSLSDRCEREAHRFSGGLREFCAQALKRRSAKIHRSQPACRQHQRPRYRLRIIGMLWTGRSCRRRQCWLWRERKHATGPASAPKLRQNRITRALIAKR
jgi:hypothetical protein